MRIYTHIRPDLDACASVWALRKFNRDFNKAVVEFVPANWDGSWMKPGDMALDIDAGGKGVKGHVDENGTVHSCFVTIMAKYAHEHARSCLEPLMSFIDSQDSYGNAYKHMLGPNVDKEVLAVLSATGLNAVFRALERDNGNDSHMLLYDMSVVFNGFFESGQMRAIAKSEAKSAEIVSFGKSVVAVIKDSRSMGTQFELFDQGVDAVIYVDGMNMGLVMNSDILRRQSIKAGGDEVMDLIVKANEVGDWFVHPAGFLCAHGTKKAPAKKMSVIRPFDLARSAAIDISKAKKYEG